MAGEYIFFLALVTLVSGYTPTFRNEATHPLKAPTESTLGLQMNDESVGRTKSNPSKAEPYSTGGKHFEYLVLNDSSVLLTSLQNDNLDLGAVQQIGSDNDTYSTKSNFLSHDNAKVTLTTTPSRVISANAINNGWKAAEMGKIVSKSGDLYSSKITESSEGKISKPKDPNKLSGSGGEWGKRQSDYSSQVAEFAASRGKISSTTKLYSRKPNRTENFATFTSPLAASKVQVGSDKDESLQFSLPSEQPQSKITQTLAPNVQKQSYDYDDSFTKLLISNGILKPENKGLEQTTQDVVPFKGVFYSQEPKDSNPSAEDVSRIMDGNFGGSTQNDSLSRILKSPMKQIAEPVLREHKNETSIQPTETNIQQASNSTPKTEQTVRDNAALITHSLIRKPNQESADLTINLSATDPKLIIDDQRESNTEIVPSSVLLLEELTTVTTSDSNSTFTSDTPQTIDTSLSTTPADKSSIHLEKRLIRTYETTSQAKTISSAEFVHTDQSNENPLSAKAYTDIISNEESVTENLPIASQPLLQQSEYDPEEDHYPNRPFPVLNRFLVDYQVLNVAKRSTRKPPQLPQPPQALTLEQHIISVSEFKGLIEDSIRHLFYFVARFIREQNLLTPQMLLENSSTNNRVTLKRFGFVNVMHAFNATAENFDRYDVSSWRDIADGSSKKVNVPLNQLFDDNDNENVRWTVFTSVDNLTFEKLQRGIVTTADYTLAARLSLEYCGLKINAIIALPSEVATNVTLPDSDESSIDVNEELLIEEPVMSATNVELEIGAGRYRVLQLFSKYSQAWTNTQASKMRSVDFEYQHEDVEFYIFVLGGAVCIFSILSPMLYGIYKIIHSHRMHSSSSTPSFRLPSIFRRDKFRYQQSHEKMPESRCESLNVIFSEEFDRKYSSWFDNTHHSSSILKASADGGSTSGGLFNDDSLDDYPEFSDLTRNVCENNSPRLSKENRLNMGCRPACVLLPHPATYLMHNEKDERYFDNPNYSR